MPASIVGNGVKCIGEPLHPGLTWHFGLTRHDVLMCLEIMGHHQGQHLPESIGLKLDGPAINASHLDHVLAGLCSLIDVVRWVEETDNRS